MSTHPRVPTEGLVLVGMSTCAPCNAAAQWLDENRIVHRKVAVDDGGQIDADLCAWLTSVTHERTVPQFFLDGRWLSRGFIEVRELVGAGFLPAHP